MSPHRQLAVGFIVVNYNSSQATAQLLADLLKQDTSKCDLTVVVADNNSSRSCLAALQVAHSDNPAVRFEAMATNLGYFGAAHCVVETVWKDHLPDWIIVSNADIRLPQPDFFARIASVPAGVGAVIAPRIVSSRTGLDQNPFHHGRPSALRINLNRIIPRVAFLFWLMQIQSAFKRAIRMRVRGQGANSATGSAKIYAPHGAFIIFGREYFARGGRLNAGAFLYAEEIFVAETCRRLGLGIAYLPELEVIHDEHVSTSAHPSIRDFQARAADYCAREFFS